jgi:pyrroloquinoline quinone biosynthesis protein B
LIRLRILGSAAGGGLPQWNCSCPNCAAARAGKIPPQTQSSVALSTGDGRWFLVNASPDLPQQIEAFPELQPERGAARNSPIAGVFLTNADLDHALGLLLMRQGQTPLAVYATDQTRRALAWMEDVLSHFCRINWQPMTREFHSLGKGIAFRAIASRAGVAFQFRDEDSGAVTLLAPAVNQINPALRNAINQSDFVLFDGTFWSNDELRAFRPNARTAREMNHLPISEGSLDFLRQSTARRKIYTHINNTNPILMPGSKERRQVEEAGLEMACDGLEIVS